MDSNTSTQLNTRNDVHISVFSQDQNEHTSEEVREPLLLRDEEDENTRQQESEASSNTSNENQNDAPNSTVYTIQSLNATNNAANLPRILQTSRQTPFWKRGIFCELLWFTVSNIVLLATLIVHHYHTKSGNVASPDTTTDSDDGNSTSTFSLWTCDSKSDRLQHWAVFQLIVQALMQVTNGSLQWKLPRSDTEQIHERRLQNIMTLYILSRFLNLVWLVWTLLGIIWTFETRDCEKEIGILFHVCFVLSIIHLIAFCLPIIICCCSVPLGLLVYCFCPSLIQRNNGEQPKRASKREIKKLTTSRKYKPNESSTTNSQGEFTILPEDASCAICLSEYSSGEEIRFLRCKHHFHSDCIIQWLTKNKTCPMCKQSIDEKDQEDSKKKSSSVSSSSSSTSTATTTTTSSSSAATTTNNNNNNYGIQNQVAAFLV